MRLTIRYSRIFMPRVIPRGLIYSALNSYMREIDNYLDLLGIKYVFM